MQYQYILFDLDGTLTDPKEGITKSFQFALQSFGIVEHTENLLKVIGPPLIDSFKDFYGFTNKQAQEAVKKYRQRFESIGLYENALYPGVKEMLSDLKKHGKKIALATSKPQKFAIEILKHFEIVSYFDVTVGSELDGKRSEKSEVIGEVLRQFSWPPKESVLMIGDRKYDILGGRKCGVDTVGVTFGYAEPGEFESVRPKYIINSMKALHLFLLNT